MTIDKIDKKLKSNGAKYRPQLTANQVTQALNLAKLDLGNLTSNTHSESLALISTLAPFKAKIDNMALVASYTPVKRVSKEAKLDIDLGMGGVSCIDTANTGTKEQQWESAYLMFSQTPELCTATQIVMAKEHMYLNDLMTDTEELAYETALADQANSEVMS